MKGTIPGLFALIFILTLVIAGSFLTARTVVALACPGGIVESFRLQLVEKRVDGEVAEVTEAEQEQGIFFVAPGRLNVFRGDEPRAETYAIVEQLDAEEPNIDMGADQ